MNETTDGAGVELADHASFLLSQLGAHAAQRFAERLQPLGLDPKQFGVLTQLAKSDGQSQQQLADAMRLHRNVMVGLIDELEGGGFVQRRRHPSDRRAHAVHLTETAWELLPPAREALDALDTELIGGLAVEEQRHLTRLLRNLTDAAGLAPGVHPNLP
ncbi:MarR family winged helix-turn-helix transcriptional regulator [Haloactinospora alba]|uniref:MarR family winged helix-turn-helix transcriptional regulator n=1 Tax=Haloactinospora alba TaxID=405555 RepID=UPI00114E3556|nr:MarR family transcriptional regulator [Haloactinospora alba]